MNEKKWVKMLDDGYPIHLLKKYHNALTSRMLHTFSIVKSKCLLLKRKIWLTNHILLIIVTRFTSNMTYTCWIDMSIHIFPTRLYFFSVDHIFIFRILWTRTLHIPPPPDFVDDDDLNLVSRNISEGGFESCLLIEYPFLFLKLFFFLFFRTKILNGFFNSKIFEKIWSHTCEKRCLNRHEVECSVWKIYIYGSISKFSVQKKMENFWNKKSTFLKSWFLQSPETSKNVFKRENPESIPSCQKKSSKWKLFRKNRKITFSKITPGISKYYCCNLLKRTNNIL